MATPIIICYLKWARSASRDLWHWVGGSSCAIKVSPVILKLIAEYVVRFPIEVMAATDTMYSKLGATSCSVTLVLEVFTVV